MRRRERVAKAYNARMLRPMRLVALEVGRMLTYAKEQIRGRAFPVYAWRDKTGRIHLLCATRRIVVQVGLWEADVATLLDKAPFTVCRLNPDPTATRKQVEAMVKAGLVPPSWEEVK